MVNGVGDTPPHLNVLCVVVSYPFDRTDILFTLIASDYVISEIRLRAIYKTQNVIEPLVEKSERCNKKCYPINKTLYLL